MAEQIALLHGDEYRLAIARFWTGYLDEAHALLALARQRSDTYWQARAIIDIASALADDDPVATKPLLAEADAVVSATGSRRLRDEMLLIHAEAARSEGDLRACIDVGRRLLQGGGPTPTMPDLLHVGSFAALLALDEDTLRHLAAAGERLERKAPGYAVLARNARHRLELFEGQPSSVDPELRTRMHHWRASCGTLWLICREAIDAGGADLALTRARALGRPAPHGLAILAAVEAATTGDEDRWHDALALALGHDLRLIAVDALEGLGVAAARTESWAECLRLLGAADRLRDETGYRWRFAFEQQALDTASTAARAELAAEATRRSDTHR